jgi:glycosyltransferase involved in cell wall biosynthesis
MLAADARIDFTGIFASDAGALRPSDSGYGIPVAWGVDPLSGYRSVFLRRASRNPPGGGGVFSLHDLDVVGVLLRRERFEVLWLHGYHTITHVAAALAQRSVGGARMLREEQNLLTPRPRWKTALKPLLFRPIYNGAYGLYIGTENRRWLERLGFPADRLFPVQYVVDNDALQAAAAELAPQREELKEQLGVPADVGPVLLMVGRLIPKKQPLHVLEAFRRVRSTRPSVLLVVGSGPLEAAMREKVAAEGIPDVVFAGFLDQTRIAEAYAVADAFVLVSSHDETWGVVVNEAMNFGLPVVASDRVGSSTDLVHDGRNGFVVSATDQAALVAAFEALIDSKELRTKYGQESREIIAGWTYDRAAVGLREAIAAAVGPERWAGAA